MQKYNGQALAVIMIVLVISVILGLSMLSRTLRDTKQLADEKSSAEALEFADSVLDTVKGASVLTLKDVCSDSKYGEGLESENGCTADGVAQVKEFLTSAGVDDNTLNVFDKCSNESSKVQLSAKLAGADDDMELRADSVRSFVVREQTPTPSSCSLNLTFEPRGSSLSGVMISNIYARNYTDGVPAEFKEYGIGDILQYCIYTAGSDCASSTSLLDTWTPVESGSTISLPLNSVGGFALDEIRVRSMTSTVAIKASLSHPDCIKDWEMVKVTVGANCTGTFRAKEVQVPQTESARPIFDYVLFNGNGVLAPE